jgi:hypothetical protein
MREFRPYGSVRGARSDARPYRDHPLPRVLDSVARKEIAVKKYVVTLSGEEREQLMSTINKGRQASRATIAQSTHSAEGRCL